MSPSQILELIASLSLQAAIVVLAAHWLCKLTDNERAQYRIWVLCFGVLLALCIVGVVLPHVRLFHPWQADGVLASTFVAESQIWLGQWLVLIWIGGATIAVGIFLVRWLRFHAFLANCEELDKETSEQLLASGTAPTGISMRVSPILKTPFCSQFHTPIIVLPTYLLEFEPDELRQVIRHELEHLQTGHPLHLFLQRIVEVVFWFHPMVWWASQQCAQSREFVCDAATVGNRNEIATYLRTLMKVVEHCAEQHNAPPLAFGRRRSLVARRADRLVRKAECESGRRRFRNRSFAVTAAFLGCALVSSFAWLPIDAFGSPRSRISPWPRWSARLFHDCGVPVRDYETFHRGTTINELREHNAE